MIGLFTCYLAGLLTASLLWLATRPLFSSDPFERTNYRGHRLPTAVGVLVPLSVGLVVALRTLVESTALGRGAANGWTLLVYDGPRVVALALAFGLLGFVDDLAGTGESGGFRGHLRALVHGRLTTGAVKMIGGPVFAVVVLASGSLPNDLSSTVALGRDALLVSLAANLANLLDRGPGRVDKVAQLCGIALVALTRDVHLGGVVVALGAGGGLLVPDLREHLMLGDCGANVLGAVLGFGVVVSTTGTQRWVVLGVVLAANAASEVVSYSKVIDRVAVLRWLDRLGAPHRRAEDRARQG